MERQSRWIITANRGFIGYALEELRGLFDQIQFETIQKQEIGIITVKQSESDVHKQLRDCSFIFLRHISPVQIEGEWSGKEEDLLTMLMPLVTSHTLNQKKVAVQIRKEAGKLQSTSLGMMKKVLDNEILEVHNIVPVIRDADYILSVFITESYCYAGISTPKQNLHDWSGGAIRFQKEPDLISRAAFKLLEAEKEFDIPFGQFNEALDLGAAPGGWTWFLVQAGLKVTAVDTALLDERVRLHPQVTFLQKNVRDVRFRPNTFDLIVCDMSWSPKNMADLVEPLLISLKSTGLFVVTLKLMHKKPFQSIDELMSRWEHDLKRLHVKQLFHNRNELTMVFVKK